MSNKINLNQNNISFLDNLDSQLCIISGVQDKITLSGDGTDSNFIIDILTNSSDDSGIYFDSIFNITTNLTKTTFTATGDLTIGGQFSSITFDSGNILTLTVNGNLTATCTDPLSNVVFDPQDYTLFDSPEVIIQDGGTPTPDSSSIFTINSTTKGFSISNLTTSQRNAISSPPEGLMVYDTTLNDLFAYVTKASPVRNEWLSVNKRYYISINLTTNINSGTGPVDILFGNNATVVSSFGMSYNTTTSQVSFNMGSGGYFAFYTNVYITNIGGTQNGRLVVSLYADNNPSSNIERSCFLIIEGASLGELNSDNFAVIGRTFQKGVDFTNTVTVEYNLNNAFSCTFERVNGDDLNTWYGFTQI